MAVGTLDGDVAGKDRGSSSVIADGDVPVVWQERLVRTEETADAGGMVDGGVEVGVVGYVDGFEESGSGDGVKSRFGGLAVRWVGVDVKESGKSVSEERPGAWAVGHEWVEDGSLAGGGEAGRQEAGFGAGVEVEQVGSDSYAEARLTVEFEGSVREMGQGEICCGNVCGGQPALMGYLRLLSHGA